MLEETAFDLDALTAAQKQKLLEALTDDLANGNGSGASGDRETWKDPKAFWPGEMDIAEWKGEGLTILSCPEKGCGFRHVTVYAYCPVHERPVQ